MGQLHASHMHLITGDFASHRNLPRQTFGKLQAKLFPAYFAFSVAAVAVQLGTLALGSSIVPTTIWGALGMPTSSIAFERG